MKKTMKFAAICAIVGGMLLTGCSKEENTALNINDVTTETTIVGGVQAFRTQITRDTLDNPIFTEVAVPTTGRTIFVGVPNSNFTGSGSGFQWFETTIDNNSRFSITVPVVNTANVVIYAEAFTIANHQVMDGPDIVTYSALQRVNQANVSVQAGNTHVHNITYTLQVIN